MELDAPVLRATGIRLARCALSDSSGKASLHISPETNTGSSSLDQSTAYALPTQETDVLRMAELFAREGLERADLVKMDIEGFEYEAIFGSRELFTGRRIRAFALELRPSRIQRRGLDPAAIASFLSGAGYAPHKDFASVWIAPES